MSILLFSVFLAKGRLRSVLLPDRYIPYMSLYLQIIVNIWKHGLHCFLCLKIVPVFLNRDLPNMFDLFFCSCWSMTKDNESRAHFLLVYGSQTGQAKAIAEEFEQMAIAKGLSPNLVCFSQYDKKVWLLQRGCLHIFSGLVNMIKRIELSCETCLDSKTTMMLM